MSNPSGRRVIAYVDGFNLYFGLRDAGYARYLWLDIHALARNLLRRGQMLIEAKYFTARISGSSKATPANLRKHLDAKQRRQAAYLEALASLPGLQIIEGHFLPKTMTCKRCHNTWDSPEEKMTDVQIATELLTDAYQDRFDTALLISGDSDLVPPIRSIRRLFPHKRVVVCFPPRRHAKELRQVAHAAVSVGRRTLAKSLLPPQVVLPDGTTLSCPPTWR